MNVIRAALAIVAMLLAAHASAANRPAGYRTICNEGKTCSVATTTHVAFGRADKFFYKVLTGSFVCNEATFGSRVAGGTNECSVPIQSSSSSSSSSAAYVSGQGYYPGCAKPTLTAEVRPTWTTVVPAGQTFDGGNRRYLLAYGEGAESVPKLFTLQEGAKLKNVIVAANSAPEIECLGNCTLDHVWWESAPDPAVVARGPAGTIASLSCGALISTGDYAVRHIGVGEVRISDFYISSPTGVYRSCSDCVGNGQPRKVTLNNIATRGLPRVVGLNKNFGDTASIRNLIIDNTTATKTDVCQTWQGVIKGQGMPSLLGTEWGTATCDVTRSNVTLLGASVINP